MREIYSGRIESFVILIPGTINTNQLLYYTTPRKKYPENISNFRYSTVWPFMNKSYFDVDVVKGFIDISQFTTEILEKRYINI